MPSKIENKIKGPHNVEVLENVKMAKDINRLVLKNRVIAKNVVPGQFVSILCKDLVLRRPFSVANAKNDEFEIIYKIKGKGTGYMSELKPGDSLDIIGPFGNGFNIENKKTLLIGCGVGIAPVLFLSEALEQREINYKLIACSQTAFSAENIFNKKKSVVQITEDGSAGLKGRLDNHLENIIKEVNPDKIYTCGPNPAMDYVCNIAEKDEIPVEVALEREFACGTGVCMGCVIEINQNGKILNKRICKDGPVFNGNEVVRQ